MLSLSDLRHLEAAEAWLERGDYCGCFDELKRINNDRDDVRVQALLWRLYNAAGLHVAAADTALDIQHQHPKEIAGHIWRSLSLQNGLMPFLFSLFAW
jgi:hypothetical protein